LKRGDKVVLFDFDGTIIDSVEATYEVFKEYVEMHGKSFISYQEFRQRFTTDWISFLKKFDIDINDEDQNINHLIEQYLHAIQKAKIDPIIAKTIRSLKEQGYTIGIVSASLESVIKNKLHSEGIFVDLIISGFELKITDKTQLLQITLNKLPVDPDNILYIGDMTDDIQAGKNVGIKVIALTTGVHSKKELEAAGAETVVSDSRILFDTVTKNLFN
jgi:phosphoglycolate phosphatase